MKKFAKMSLVAAVAVAGMATTGSAKDLTEAIKGVDISGSIVYRYDDRNNENASGLVRNRYKLAVTVKAPVNDDVTAVTRVMASNGSAAGGFTSLDTSDNADQEVGMDLTQVNFVYTGIANTTVIAGKQGITTPWTKGIDSDGNETTGTGLAAVASFGPVTAVGTFYNQTNLDTSVDGEWAGAINGGRDVYAAGLMASFAGVNVEAWHLDIADTLDTQFFAANTSFMVSDDVKIGLDAKYTTVSFDNENAGNDDVGNWEAGITANVGMFNAGIAYAESDEDNAGILNSVAKNGQIGYSVNLNGTEDAEMIMVDLGAQITPELHVGLNYDEIEDKTSGSTADDHDETFVQVTYKMSKNFTTYVRLADGEDNNVDYNRGRLQVEYTF